MAAKYVITDEVHPDRPELHRIKPTEEFSLAVETWLGGGWVQSERNLSQDGDCWIFDDAICSGYGYVTGHARVRGHAEVRGGYVGDNGWVGGDAVIGESVEVRGDGVVSDHADLTHCVIGARTIVTDHAFVRAPRDLLTIGPIGSENRVAVLHRSYADGTAYEVRAGCWRGTVNQLRMRVWPDGNGDTVWTWSGRMYAREYLAWCDVMEARVVSWDLKDVVQATASSDVWHDQLDELVRAGIKARTLS